ncbi:hypothetical protein AGLY_017338, partial [Aphis glycines]
DITFLWHKVISTITGVTKLFKQLVTPELQHIKSYLNCLKHNTVLKYANKPLNDGIKFSFTLSLSQTAVSGFKEFFFPAMASVMTSFMEVFGSFSLIEVLNEFHSLRILVGFSSCSDKSSNFRFLSLINTSSSCNKISSSNAVAKTPSECNGALDDISKYEEGDLINTSSSCNKISSSDAEAKSMSECNDALDDTLEHEVDDLLLFNSKSSFSESCEYSLSSKESLGECGISRPLIEFT